MMDPIEYQKWRKEQLKKTVMPKRRKPHLWNNKETRDGMKIQKYGIYPFRGFLPGSFEGNSK